MPTRVEPAVFAGERLRAARVLIGASRTELAAAVGVSQAQVSHVESGRRAATADVLGLPAFTLAPP